MLMYSLKPFRGPMAALAAVAALGACGAPVSTAPSKTAIAAEEDFVRNGKLDALEGQIHEHRKQLDTGGNNGLHMLADGFVGNDQEAVYLQGSIDRLEKEAGDIRMTMFASAAAASPSGCDIPTQIRKKSKCYGDLAQMSDPNIRIAYLKQQLEKGGVNGQPLLGDGVTANDVYAYDYQKEIAALRKQLSKAPKPQRP